MACSVAAVSLRALDSFNFVRHRRSRLHRCWPNFFAHPIRHWSPADTPDSSSNHIPGLTGRATNATVLGRKQDATGARVLCYIVWRIYSSKSQTPCAAKQISNVMCGNGAYRHTYEPANYGKRIRRRPACFLKDTAPVALCARLDIVL